MNQETRKEAMYQAGRAAAQELQKAAPAMTGTQLYGAAQDIPDFLAARQAQNMLTRPAGMTDGFVCKSSEGRVVRLLQPYDSDIYTQEPEELPAQWGFVWSNDPAHALPFLSMATSPYMTGNVCSENGIVYRSTHDNNVWAPSAYPDWWEVATDDWEPPVVEPEEPDPVPEPEPEPEQPEGSKDNPITASRGMTYEYGLYYYDPEDGKTYLCQRQNETGTIKLEYLPHELIGHYFVEV